jgi:hypothetical protein
MSNKRLLFAESFFFDKVCGAGMIDLAGKSMHDVGNQLPPFLDCISTNGTNIGTTAERRAPAASRLRWDLFMVVRA